MIQAALQRNQGNVLTPELTTGLLAALDAEMADSLYSSVPQRVVDYPQCEDSRLVLSEHEWVCGWVAERVGNEAGFHQNACAIGLLGADGNLVAGVVFENITGANAFVHVAFANRWAMKRVLMHAFYDYAFRQLGLKRLTGYVEASNVDALRFDQHLGFQIEHTIKDGSDQGDVHMLVLWPENWRWANREG